MLVLSRKQNETIIINGNIRVTILAIKEDRVRVGITAPADVRVDREEIHRARLDPEIEAELNDLQGDKKSAF